jgi:hypothetical protein
LRVFPVRAQGTAIRNVLRAAAVAKWGADVIKLIEHDDHWMRPSNLNKLKNAKLPAFFVGLNAGETPAYGDQQGGHVDCETAWDIVFLEQADLAELRVTASEAIEWAYELFGQEDQGLSGFSADGVLLKHCVPVRFEHFNELLEFGLIGSRVTLENATAHEDPDE